MRSSMGQCTWMVGSSEEAATILSVAGSPEAPSRISTSCGVSELSMLMFAVQVPEMTRWLYFSSAALMVSPALQSTVVLRIAARLSRYSKFALISSA